MASRYYPDMGHRLSRITTRTGDDGTTGLADGSRLPKSHPRVHALGEVDELNSQIGLLRAQITRAAPGAEGSPESQSLTDLDQMLLVVQHDLFDLGGTLCMPGHEILELDRLIALDGWIETLNATLPPLKEFILPAGSLAIAQAHVARTVARRAERSLIAIESAESAASCQTLGLPRKYLNRLSDLLFVLGRSLAARLGQSEVYWRRADLEPPAVD